MQTQTALQAADAAIASYDAFIFAAVGRPFDADKADTLAAVAAVECEAAARVRNEPQWVRDHYAARRDEFRAVCA